MGKVLIINGSNRVGKNKFTRFFTEYCNGSTFEISTVDVLKRISKRYFGWDGKKTDGARRLLSDLKKVWIEFNNGPFNDTIKKIDEKNADYSFIHCRESEEMQKFKEYYGDRLVTILMKKDDRPVANNSSDMNVNNYDYDYVIDNNGTKKELEEKLKIFTESFIEEHKKGEV